MLEGQGAQWFNSSVRRLVGRTNRFQWLACFFQPCAFYVRPLHRIPARMHFLGGASGCRGWGSDMFPSRITNLIIDIGDMSDCTYILVLLRDHQPGT